MEQNGKSVLWEMGKSVFCEMKNLYLAKWKSVLVYLMQDENPHFAKWKSVLCEMKICTWQDENPHFAKQKSTLCELKIYIKYLKINGIAILAFLS